jgi:hypothetical protein
VEYKKGVDNKVADALSRREGWENEATLSSISLPVVDWVEHLKFQYHHDLDLMKLIQQWNSNKLDHQKYSMRQGLLLYKNRIHIGGALQLQQQVLQFVHCDPVAGHSGYERTMQRARRDFYWRGMKQSVKKFIRECLVCQQNKQENTSPAGLLQPLPIPNRVWSDISLDFVEGLPLSHGHSVILVVVDRLSKYAHFISLAHPYTAVKVARLFIDNILKLHELPTSIVSDRDPIFTSHFWKELFKQQGTTLKMSYSYHPQTDGQSEVVNKCLENYLRCFTQDRPKQWVLWLPWAEFWYNTTWHSSIKMTPYEAVYGQPPPKLLSYILGTTNVAAVDELLRTREQILALLQQNNKQAQQRMKKFADLRRSERTLEVNQQVFLRLQPYRQTSVATRRALKLAPRFYGPFTVLRRVGDVAYELDLPATSRIHPVFHVSQLKPKLGANTSPIPVLPPVNLEGIIQPEPMAILDRRSRPLHNRAFTEVLVHWSGQTPKDATWEDFHKLTHAYPHLVGKVL